MPPGLDSLKHIVVLMMENRSFDHMLGGAQGGRPAHRRPDRQRDQPRHHGTPGASRSRRRSIRASSIPIPNHDFAPVDQQIFNGGADARRHAGASSQSYFEQRRDVKHSRKIMYYFKRREAAGADDAGARVRGVQPLVLVDPRADALQPRVRALRHVVRPRRHGALLRQPEVQEHLRAAAGRRAHARRSTTSISKSSTMEIVNLLQNQPQFFGTYEQFLTDCQSGHAAATTRSSSRTTAITTATAGRCSPPISTPITTCARASGSSRRSTTRSRPNPALWESTALLDHLRRARRHLRSRAAAGLHAGRLRRAAGRDRHRQAVHVRSARRPRAGGARLAVGAEGHGRRRPGVRARVDSGHGDEMAASAGSTTASARRARRRPRRFWICCRSARCGPTARTSTWEPPRERRRRESRPRLSRRNAGSLRLPRLRAAWRRSRSPRRPGKPTTPPGSLPA